MTETARENCIRLLDGRVRIASTVGGLRPTSDSVLLAAAAPVRPGMRVLDVGCGTGAVACCLAARVGGLDLHGLEIADDLARLSVRSARMSGAKSWSIHVGDALAPPASLSGRSFDLVCTNPPWVRGGAGTPSPDPARNRAKREPVGGLPAWIRACARFAGASGTVVAILPAERLAECAAVLDGWSVRSLAIAPRRNRAPTRAILRGSRTGSPGHVAHAAIVLHSGDGYSGWAQRALRDAAALPWPRRGDP